MEIIQLLFLRWFLTIITSSLIYGNLSVLVSARRLYFLAGAAPHSALLAAVIAVVLSNIVGLLNDLLWSIVVGCLLMTAVGHFIRKGYDSDVVTSIYVALTASASVVVMSHVLTTFRLSYSLWSIILGDPLLTTWAELIPTSLLALLTTALTVASLKYHVYAGVDPDYVRLVSKRGWLHDYTLFILLGVTSVALIKVTGFILQHVLILLPSITASKLTESSGGAYLTAVAVSVLAGILGLEAAILFNVSPSGMVGAVLIAAYIISIGLSKI